MVMIRMTSSLSYYCYGNKCQKLQVNGDLTHRQQQKSQNDSNPAAHCPSVILTSAE